MYNFLLILFLIIKPVFVLFNSKFAKREKEWKKVLSNNLEKLRLKGNRKTIWVHASSMGEFEQAKPLIEKFKSIDPNFFIVSTFFSPSGYDNQKNYQYSDVCLYLPMDNFWLVKKFIKIIEPNIAIFIRYELWLNYLSELKKKKVPTFLVAATKPNKWIFFIYKIYIVKCFNLFTKIFVSDENDFDFFASLDLKVPTVVEYDTRYDRVYSKINNLDVLPFCKNHFKDFTVLIAGSVWEPDLELLFEVRKKFNKIIKIIYVPHEVKESVLKFVERNDRKCIRFSELINKDYSDNEIRKLIQDFNILVDKVGFLLSLYSIGDLAYVGGGFGRGIHSVIEPAGFNLPVICGGNINNSRDALRMLDFGTLWVVRNGNELENVLTKLQEESFRLEVSSKMKEYFLRRVGSSERIVKETLSCSS